MTGYVRTDTTNNIADGNIINATDLDNEFDGVQAAFNSSTGHNHDGTTGEGAPILVLGPTQDVVVGAAAVTPKTTNTVDIGSGSLKFKDLFLAGNASVGGTLAVTGVATLTAQPVLSSLTASSAVATDASKGLVSVTNTGTGNNVLATSPTLVTPALGTPSSATLTNATGLPVSTGISGLGTGVATALAVNVGTAGAPVINGGVLGTPSSGVVTNLTGTASININGTVGATTANTGAFTTLTTSSTVTLNGGTASGVAYLDGSKVLTTGSALTFDGTTLATTVLSSAALNVSNNASAINLTNASYGQIVSTNTLILDTTAGDMLFRPSATEQMRLTSTGLGVGTSSPAGKLEVNGLTFVNNTGSSTGRFLIRNSTTGTSAGGLDIQQVGVDASINNASNGYMSFSTNNTERMRLDSSGNLGIGTSSPISGFKLSLSGGGAYIAAAPAGAAQTGAAVSLVLLRDSVAAVGTASTGAIAFSSSPGSDFYVGKRNDTAGTAWLSFGNANNNTEYAQINSSGNLGLGVTPSAWGSNYRAVEVSGAVNVFGNTGDANFAGIGANLYHNNTNYLYRYSTLATMYLQDNGTHQWHIAPSGTAGNAISFTQAMSLDADGILLLGATSRQANESMRIGANGVQNALLIGNSSQNNGAFLGAFNDAALLGVNRNPSSGTFINTSNRATDIVIVGSSTDSYISFETATAANTAPTERARIDSSGNLLINATAALTSADNRLSVSGVRGIEARSTGGATAATQTLWNNATSDDNVFVSFRTETSDTQRGTISYNRTAGLVAYNTTSDYRAKDIYGPVTDSGALIDSTPVYMGKMKGATQERPMFIAHEVPAYAHTGEKDAVDDDGKPVYQQMDASALIPVMWAEIQSLRTRLAALEAA